MPLWLKRRKLTGREMRLCFYGFIVAGFALWKFVPRPWNPAMTVQTEHFKVLSTASPKQVEEVSVVLEQLFRAYALTFGSLPTFRETNGLKVKLYKDRNEMRRINPGLGWAEAFYRKPYCHAYYSESESNPYHWMVHEAVHQLNEEVAHLDLAKWLEEGLAEYFSTSQRGGSNFMIGTIDRDTYPIWWIDEMARSGDLTTDIREGSVIPLRRIITNRGGPSMRRHFNLYYLHWWSLTHFVFQTEKYRTNALALVRDGGGLKSFEQHIGPVEKVQSEWYAHVLKLKKELGANLPTQAGNRPQTP